MIKNPKTTAPNVFHKEALLKISQLKFLVVASQFFCKALTSVFENHEPILTARLSVTRLIHVFVSTLPNNAAALLTFKNVAKATEAIGPMPGKIPKNTPKPSPKAVR